MVQICLKPPFFISIKTKLSNPLPISRARVRLKQMRSKHSWTDGTVNKSLFVNAKNVAGYHVSRWMLMTNNRGETSAGPPGLPPPPWRSSSFSSPRESTLSLSSSPLLWGHSHGAMLGPSSADAIPGPTLRHSGLLMLCLLWFPRRLATRLGCSECLKPSALGLKPQLWSKSD